MQKKPKNSDDPAELRRRAEALLNEQRKSQPPKSGDHSEADSERLLQELEVHQIELEMQNAELQQAREKLEASLEKFTDLYDFAPVGYLTLDPKKVIREINLTGATLLGIERSALVNRHFGTFVSAADTPVFDAFLQKVFASKVRQGCEVALKLEGRPPLDAGLEAIAFESGLACRVMLADITERKRAEADRLILNKLESTGILAAGIAHDFNNLFTVILLNLEMAQMNPSGAELAGHLEEAKRTSLQARGLTAQLVTLAKGGAPVRRAMFISELIQESVRIVLSGSNVRCEFSQAEDVWATEVDAEQFGQVIRNMVLNAREAMPQGGMVLVRAENVVPGSDEQPSLPPGEYVRVSITDQGTGIPKDVLPKIFDPYFSTKQLGEKKGMGLGLTVCHAIVRKHGGAIAVESTPGGGITFHIYLPAVRTVAGEEAAPATKAVSKLRRILVMDDAEPIRKGLGLMLRKMGYEVETAEDGQGAIEAYKNAAALKRPFDAVFLDLMVQGEMGGQETMQALLAIDPGVKAVVMSGYSDDPVILEHARHGFKAALMKPFGYKKIAEIISGILEAGTKA